MQNSAQGFVCTDKMPFTSSLEVNIYTGQLGMDQKHMKSLSRQAGKKKGEN